MVPKNSNLLIPLLEPAVPGYGSPFHCITRTNKNLLSGAGKGIRYPGLGRLQTVDDFFRFQHETSQTIAQVKDAVAKKYKAMLDRDFPELAECPLFLSEKRKHMVMARGVHSRVYTLALGGRDNSVFLPRVGASIEFLLEDMYYLNQFFDSKSGRDAAANITAAIQSNDLFWPLLVPPGVSREKQQEVFAELNEDFNNVISGFYFGEYVDCNHNVWERLKNTPLEERMRSFNRRTYYINTLFFQAIASMAETVVRHQRKPPPEKQSEALSRYAHYFGMGLQCVNDVADFVPPDRNIGTSAKENYDSYSDIRDGKMTLPVIMMLEMADEAGKRKVIACLEKGFDSSEEELRQTTDIFLRSGAYNECRRLCRKYQRAARECSRQFEEPAHFLLSGSAVILDSNRYFRTFTEMQKGQ